MWAWEARHGSTSAQYQATFDKLVGQGYRLVDVSGYSVNGQDRYAAIWVKSGGPAWQARHGLTSAQYQATFDKLVGQDIDKFTLAVMVSTDKIDMPQFGRSQTAQLGKRDMD